MKLSYIADIRLPTEKAHGAQIMKTCEAFSLNGIDTELIVPWRFNHIKENPFTYYNIRGNFKITKIPSLDLVRLGRIGFLAHSLSFSLSVFFYLFFKKTHIIYSRDELPIFCLCFFKKRVFWEAHINRYNHIIKRLFVKCSGVVTITEGLKNFYVNKGVEPSKIVVAPDGIDLADFLNRFDKNSVRKELGLPLDKKIALYIGRLDGWKGAETLLAASRLLPQHIQAVLIGGEPREVSRLKKEYQQAIFLGFLPYRELAKNQTAADVLILPNSGKNEVSANFTSPLKLFSYMASGLPIVASDLLSIKEILNNDNAFFFESDNPKSLAEAINMVLRDNELSDKISKQASLDVEKYTWVKRAEKITDFIKSIE